MRTLTLFFCLTALCVVVALGAAETQRSNIVIVLADNLGYGDVSCYGGKSSAFEAGTRVPFIVHWLKKVKPGVSNAVVSLMDLPASFAALTKQMVESTAFPDSENVLLPC